MKILLTGGGTAGHITPNLAIIPVLARRGFEIRYIGLKGGMEENLIRPLGVPFYGITGGKLRRYLDVKNFTDLFKIAAGFAESFKIIKKVKPDIVFSKGGFVSTPVVWAAAACGVPVVSHESDLTVGLANKLITPFAMKICYTFPETGRLIPGNKRVHTGLPIREELLRGDRKRGLERCGFSGAKPVLVVMGGSQGSVFINQKLRRCLGTLLESFDICHICGSGNIDRSLLGQPGYRQFEYITSEQPDIFAAADIFVTRGGATSLFEILALKKPNVIVPYSTKASRGDQILNAESFRKQGFSEVLAEAGPDGAPLSDKAFVSMIFKVYENRAHYSAAMAKSPASNGLENVCRVIEECTKGSKQHRP